jgi:hypothetical protein
VTATAIPTRMLVLLGAVVAAAAAFLIARPLLLSDDDSGSSAPASTATPAKPAAKPAKPATSSTKTAPKLVLLPNLPTPVAKQLRYSKVVVVPVYSGTSKSDRVAVAQARVGARKVGAGFVPLNVLDEDTARELQPFAGTASAPAMLIVKRPGKIVTRFDTRVDSALVAQAARNAGASRAPRADAGK